VTRQNFGNFGSDRVIVVPVGDQGYLQIDLPPDERQHSKGRHRNEYDEKRRGDADGRRETAKKPPDGRLPGGGWIDSGQRTAARAAQRHRDADGERNRDC
jgi:hypothetical protein